ncbi:MAG: AMP-binding protein [Desulfobacterales bacterium]
MDICDRWDSQPDRLALVYENEDGQVEKYTFADLKCLSNRLVNGLRASADKYVGDWCLTGDLAKQDEDGYFWFVGRKDDVITSAGYRIGPAEIEDCIMKHPDVAMVAAVGSPDEVRTEIVKAFIVLKSDVTAGDDVAAGIKEFVKVRLAAHEFPREIEFVDQLPMTATGKIMRKNLKALEIKRKAK